MIKYIFILLVLTLKLVAQKPEHLSSPEIRWAFFHPFAAIKINKIYKNCLPLYNAVKNHPALDNFESGGKRDAFRHVFFTAAFAQKVRSKKVLKLGKAHERRNYKDFKKHRTESGEIPDSLSSVMDIYNNEVGIKLGTENKAADLTELKTKVLNTIIEGKALYFKRDAEGKYLACNGDPIDLKNYSGKWSVPKCLIESNK